MYYLTVWDKDLAATGKDGALSRLEIPMDMANFLFALDSEEFPILSSLSFDDYDLISGDVIESLAHELIEVVRINPSASGFIDLMLKKILEARSLEKSILFDPFRG
ncbi:hypothetical protein [Cupriavidus basilensis]|uniref:hypothetical protein n=1 Tax=Cupriavidus basilensis TaxID=68895 RepID=UPI0005BA7679|nr:hypothetical protein [Cupriavidus basilensis]